MSNVKDSAGNDCALSKEPYVLLFSIGKDYPRGTIVKLIGGVDGVNKPGYHFLPDCIAVTRPDRVEFITVRKDEIKMLKR